APTCLLATALSQRIVMSPSRETRQHKPRPAHALRVLSPKIDFATKLPDTTQRPGDDRFKRSTCAIAKRTRFERRMWDLPSGAECKTLHAAQRSSGSSARCSSAVD